MGEVEKVQELRRKLAAMRERRAGLMEKVAQSRTNMETIEKKLRDSGIDPANIDEELAKRETALTKMILEASQLVESIEATVVKVSTDA